MLILKQSVIFLILLFILTSVFNAALAIPAPDNIIFGEVLFDGRSATEFLSEVVVELRLESEAAPVTVYFIGEIAEFPGKYLLKVPIDDSVPGLSEDKPAGRARIGDSLSILVGYNHSIAEKEKLADITIIEPGKVFPLDLNLRDSDDDDLPDLWEQQIIDSDPNDTITGIEDVLPAGDFDNDGKGNLTEFQDGTNPIKDDPTIDSFLWGDVTGDDIAGTLDSSEILQSRVGLISSFSGYPELVKTSFSTCSRCECRWSSGYGRCF